MLAEQPHHRLPHLQCSEEAEQRQAHTEQQVRPRSVPQRRRHRRTVEDDEQGEREHRVPKTRYLRTDRKEFTRQLTQIERRESRLRKLKDQVAPASEVVPSALQVHHNIGKSEAKFEHIGTFLRTNIGDPAVHV